MIWRRLSTESKNGDTISSSDAFYESATEKWRRSLQEKKEHAKPMDNRDFSVPPKPTKTMYVPSRGNEHQPHMFVPESAADKYRKRREAGEVSNIFEKELEESMMHATPASLSHMRTLIGIDNICYPEMLGKLFVVNAPSVATVIYDMIK